MGFALSSLPGKGSRPTSLIELLGAQGPEIVRRFLHDCVRSKVEQERAHRESGFKRPYTDPRLRDPVQYRKLVSPMFEGGMIDFALSVLAGVGLFAATKKNGRRGLISDARESNLWFVDSHAVDLASGSPLGAVEVPAGGKVFCADADLVDCFYLQEFPVELLPMGHIPAYHASAHAMPG